MQIINRPSAVPFGPFTRGTAISLGAYWTMDGSDLELYWIYGTHGLSDFFSCR